MKKNLMPIFQRNKLDLLDNGTHASFCDVLPPVTGSCAEFALKRTAPGYFYWQTSVYIKDAMLRRETDQGTWKNK